MMANPIRSQNAASNEPYPDSTRNPIAIGITKPASCPPKLTNPITDPTIDLTAWAKSGGHELVKHEEENDVLKFWIKKA